MKLHLKILAGYILLIMLFGTVVWAVWEEKRKIATLNTTEHTMQEKRKTLNRTFERLLSLSFADDFLLPGDSNAIADYRKELDTTISTLGELRRFYANAGQQARIDSVCLFLREKATHRHRIMETLAAYEETGQLIQERIPVIVSQVRRETATPPLSKKKGGFLGLFRKKAKPETSLPPNPKTTAMLYSLGREVDGRLKGQQERLEAYADSLQKRNTQLNGKLNRIIREFEADATRMTEQEHGQIIRQREHAFRAISLAALAAILLVIVFYAIIHRDIAQKSLYRRKLEDADRRNKALLAVRRDLILTVSHDLRAPLGTISEYAELLQDEKDAELGKGYALNILHASRHVMGLANNLLYYYRIEAQKEQPENEIFHLGQTIENAAGAFLPSAEKKGLGLTVGTEGADLLVRGDAGRLVQIINNLLSNAVKFTRTGYIHVGARYGDGQLSLFVRDTGTGIEKERLQQIFTAFERGEISGTGDGYGLGLAITSKLVTLLGGDIRVQSVPGQGSTFSVRLPVGEADGKAEADEPPSGDGPLFPIRVLAIDDDRMQLDAIKKMYARSGIGCDCCQNVGELVEALRHNSYDLVLTDIRMSETDGYGVLSLLRGGNIGQSRTIPVVAVTARADKSGKHFREAGFAECLHKPFSRKELLAATYGIDRPDFTAILEDERNPEELLRIFIEDTEEELAGMREAFGTKDYGRLGNIVHKAAPLWEVIRIDIPLSELEYIASLPAEKWGGISERRFEELAGAVGKAVKKAKKILEETHGKHIDSGR